MNSMVGGQSIPNALMCVLGLAREHLSLYSCHLNSCSTPPVLIFLPLQIARDSDLSLYSYPYDPIQYKLLPPPLSPQLPHLNGKVDEATDAE